MANILITVTGQSMAYTSMPVIASHGVNEDYVVFTFDSDWTGYAKTATFYHERFPEEIYTTVVNGSNTALVPHEVTDKPGRIFIGVTGVSGNVELTSEVLPYPILPGSNMDGVNSEPPTPELYDQILSAMAEMVGTPLVANTAADMTDITRIYVYTGSEAGYVNGSWYYYDGASWQVGGTYNSQAISDAFMADIADYIRQSTVATESDRTPYLYRPTPNPSAILADEKLIGGTIAYNQLVNNGDFSDGTTNWTRVDSQSVSISVSDGVLKITATGSGSQGVYAIVPDGIVGHAYLAVLQIKAETAGHQLGVAISQSSINTNTIVPIFESPTSWTTIAGIRKVTTASQNRLRIALTTATAMAANDFFSLKNVILIDLTAMFGSTIADYLYTLESGTAGAGVAKLKEWGFLSKSYFPYNAGELMSVKTTGKKVTGKNLLSGSLAGYYSQSTGVFTANTSYASSEKIPAFPKVVYMYTIPNDVLLYNG